MADAICRIEGCERPVLRGRTICSMHKQRITRTGSAGSPVASTMVLGDRRRGKRKPVCIVEGCNKPNKAKGYCAMHWARLRATGEVGSAEARPPGIRNDRGFHMTAGGYMRLWRDGKAVLEHRVVMEEILRSRAPEVRECPPQERHTPRQQAREPGVVDEAASDRPASRRSGGLGD